MLKTIRTDCLCKYKISLRELARILRNIAASFPAVTYRPLHYRLLEKEKITGLKYHKSNSEGKIRLSAKAKVEIQWWITLTIHGTILTYLILTLLYILMQTLQVGVSLMLYPHSEGSGIRQS